MVLHNPQSYLRYLLRFIILFIIAVINYYHLCFHCIIFILAFPFILFKVLISSNFLLLARTFKFLIFPIDIIPTYLNNFQFPYFNFLLILF